MKGPAMRLVLLLVLLWGIGGIHLLRAEGGTPVTLAAGALLLAGIFAGKLAKEVGLPRLTGYLLIGMAVGPHALKFIPREGVAGLDLVKGLAVSLIAFAAGLELRLGLLRRVGLKVVRFALAICSLVFAATMAGLLALHRLLPFFQGMGWPQVVAVSALISSVVVSFSPTVTIAIVQETRAKGRFTEFLMALVILGDLVVMVAFALAGGLTQASFGGRLELGGLFGGIGWELFGSVLLGAAVGVATLLYLRSIGAELALFISVLCFAMAETGARLHLSPLLLALAAGAVIANLDEGRAERLDQAIRRAGLPVFALFFAAAGAGLHLESLTVVGPVAVVLVLLRAGAIYFAARRFAPQSDDPRVQRYAWMGLISQAGVTFGLAALLSRSFPAFGPAVEVLIVAMVTMHELIGPVLMRRALALSGELPESEARAGGI